MQKSGPQFEVLIPAIILDGNSQVRFHEHMAAVGLEHFHQICSDELRPGEPRSFWLLAAFRLSYRVRLNLRLRQSLAKSQKSSRLIATSFLSML